MMRARSDSGAALILALLATVLLSGFGVSLVLLGDTERRTATNYGFNYEALYGADAAVERAVQDLALVAQWDAILNGTQRSAFAGSTRQPTLPSKDTLDLDALTTELQAGLNAASSLGANTPAWRLFAWGPLSSLAPAGQIDTAQYLAAWIADDPSETDGNPAADVNGVVTVHAESFGLGGSRRAIEATVARVSTAVVRIVSWREVR
jgi:Tfp pilus assembly protein PilX